MPYGYDAMRGVPDLSYKYSWVNPAFSGVGKITEGVGQVYQGVKSSKEQDEASKLRSAAVKEIQDFQSNLEPELSPETKDKVSSQLEALKTAVPEKEPDEPLTKYTNRLNTYRAQVVATTAPIVGEDAMQRAATKLMLVNTPSDEIAKNLERFRGTRWEKPLQSALEQKQKIESGGRVDTALAGAMGVGMGRDAQGKPMPLSPEEAKANLAADRAAGFIPDTTEYDRGRTALTTQQQVQAISKAPNLSTGVANAVTMTGGEDLSPATKTVANAYKYDAENAAAAAEAAAKMNAQSAKDRGARTETDDKNVNVWAKNLADQDRQLKDLQAKVQAAQTKFAASGIDPNSEKATQADKDAYREVQILRAQYEDANRQRNVTLDTLLGLTESQDTDLKRQLFKSTIDNYINSKMQEKVSALQEAPMMNDPDYVKNFIMETAKTDPSLSEKSREIILRSLSSDSSTPASSPAPGVKEPRDMTDQELDSFLSDRVPGYDAADPSKKMEARAKARQMQLIDFPARK